MIAFFIALVVECLFQCPQASGVREKERLVRDLTANYVTSVEPDNAVLKFSLSFICSTYDQDSHLLVSNAWEKMTWTDTRLSWSPEDYDGIELIRLSSQLVWLPDMTLYNSMTPTVERRSTNVVVNHDGSIIWVSPTIYRTLCDEDEDEDEDGAELNCQFRIGSWTYDVDILKLEEASVEESSYLPDCPLALESVNASVQTTQYSCCKEPYSHAEVNAIFKLQK